MGLKFLTGSFGLLGLGRGINWPKLNSIGLFPDFFQDFAQKVKVLRKCHKQFANLQAVALLQ